jgi:uracil-DNA glycosylase family 4
VSPLRRTDLRGLISNLIYHYERMHGELKILQGDIVTCTLCPRLRNHCREIARVKRRAYLDHEYWGKPVPSFGDPNARVLILGLAPGAHGANRTGRMFTGDKSGEFLYRALYETGFASQPAGVSRDDGMKLTGAYITASAHCAPPDNKPAREELCNCRPYLERELKLLKNLRVVVALGRIAFDTYLSIVNERARFGHNIMHAFSPILIASYHPSQQNTSTGKLTAEMLREVFEKARRLSAITG